MKPYTGIIIALVFLILIFGGLKVYYYADKPKYIIIDMVSIDRDTNNTIIEIKKSFNNKNISVDTLKIKNESIDSLVLINKLDSLESENEGDIISD